MFIRMNKQTKMATDLETLLTIYFVRFESFLYQQGKKGS